ncbi:MAG: hypothetical protein Q8P02_00385, partial [Candidatus Micrarchaeota archaeon]|nr:hypothetical protein [Candidatus Micrarchaeota archaeon]
QTDRGTYESTLDIQDKQPAPQTGLVSYATPVIAFAAAILLALILLYFLYRESRQKNDGTPASATPMTPTATPGGTAPAGQKTLTSF